MKRHSGEKYVMPHSETLWYVKFQSKRKGCFNIVQRMTELHCVTKGCRKFRSKIKGYVKFDSKTKTES